MSEHTISQTTFERPVKGDVDRLLSTFMHDARHKLMHEQARISSEAAMRGMAQSTRVLVLAVETADKIHRDVMSEAAPVLRNFIERMETEVSTVIEWIRPHVENLNNSLLGVIKQNGFPAERERLVRQYAVVFQRRIEGLLRDLQIGYVRGAGFAARARMPDKEEWISAHEANLMVSSVMGGLATRAICKRAHDGFIAARAERFVQAGQVSDNVDVPKEFWWAEGQAALGQNWVAGDFETWINQTLELKAYGVSFRRADIEKMVPQKAESKAMPNASSKMMGAAQNSKNVFIVHGHDEAALHELARFLEKIGLKPIILKEQPDQGRTIIEKFEGLAGDVAFAVVLMTPDDLGGAATSSEQVSRARQNVIFELGYFSGSLGRGKVCLLRKGKIEIPSDLFGIIYTDMDGAGGWKARLIGELKSAGLTVDANQMWD